MGFEGKILEEEGYNGKFKTVYKISHILKRLFTTAVEGLAFYVNNIGHYFNRVSYLLKRTTTQDKTV
jgi:hypothetical protein